MQNTKAEIDKKNAFYKRLRDDNNFTEHDIAEVDSTPSSDSDDQDDLDDDDLGIGPAVPLQGPAAPGRLAPSVPAGIRRQQVVAVADPVIPQPAVALPVPAGASASGGGAKKRQRCDSGLLGGDSSPADDHDASRSSGSDSDESEERPNHGFEKKPAVLWNLYVDSLTQGQVSKSEARLKKFKDCIADVLKRCEEIGDIIKVTKWKKLISETCDAIATATQPGYKFIS